MQYVEVHACAQGGGGGGGRCHSSTCMGGADCFKSDSTTGMLRRGRTLEVSRWLAQLACWCCPAAWWPLLHGTDGAPGGPPSS